MKMCRRYGSTGTSTPAIRPIRRACGPAALTTVRVSIVPRVVSTAATRPDSTRIPVTSVSRSIETPASLRRLGEAHRDAVGIGDAVALAERRAERAVHVEPRRQPGGVLRRRATARPRPGCAAARRSGETSRRSPASTAETDSRPGESRSAGRPRRRTAPARRSIRWRGGCSPRSRTGAGRRRRCGRSIRSRAACRAPRAPRRSRLAGRGDRPRWRPCTRRR